MNILYILRHNPWGIGGGCYATRCYLEAFKEVFAGAQFDMCMCEEYLNANLNANANPNPNNNANVNFVKVAPRGKIDKMLSPVTGLLHRFDKMARKMLKSKQYNYCIFDHNSIAGPLVGLCKERGVKTIVINHNCEAEYYRDNYGSLQRLLFLRHVRKAERQSYLGCDYNIFLTEEDCTLFRQMYGQSQTNSIVTGCFDVNPNPKVNPNPNVNVNPRLVISGTIGNVQNLEGIRFFLNELLPCVPKDAEVVIAGKNPPVELSTQIDDVNRQGHYAHISLIPNPADMMDIVSSCDIFVCPTRLGSGLKLRVMDGLRAGLPVIAHKVSARGYSEFTKRWMLWSFGDREEFAICLKQVIEKAPDRYRIQEYAHSQFSMDNKVALLKKMIQ